MLRFSVVRLFDGENDGVVGDGEGGRCGSCLAEWRDLGLWGGKLLFQQAARSSVSSGGGAWERGVCIWAQVHPLPYSCVPVVFLRRPCRRLAARTCLLVSRGCRRRAAPCGDVPPLLQGSDCCAKLRRTAYLAMPCYKSRQCFFFFFLLTLRK